VRQKRQSGSTVATLTITRAIVIRVSDRGERKFLWFLVLIVGVGICVFPFAGEDPIRFVFLPLGAFLILVAWFRLRRLGRRRARPGDVE
jgi:hypothetical protein